MPGGPSEAQPLRPPDGGAGGSCQPSQAQQAAARDKRDRACPHGSFNCIPCGKELQAYREDVMEHAARHCSTNLRSAAGACICPCCGATCQLDAPVEHACFAQLQPCHPRQQQRRPVAADEASPQLSPWRLWPGAESGDQRILNAFRKEKGKYERRRERLELLEWQQQQDHMRRLARAAAELQSAAYERALIDQHILGGGADMPSRMARMAGSAAWAEGEAAAQRRAEVWVARVRRLLDGDLARAHGHAVIDARCAEALEDAALRRAAPAGLLRACSEGGSGAARAVRCLLQELIEGLRAASDAAAAVRRQPRGARAGRAAPSDEVFAAFGAIVCAWRALFGKLAPLCSSGQLADAAGLFSGARLLEVLPLLEAKCSPAAWLPLGCAAFALFRATPITPPVSAELYHGLLLAYGGALWWAARSLLCSKGLDGVSPEAQRDALLSRGILEKIQVHMALVRVHLFGPSRQTVAAIARRRTEAAVLPGLWRMRVRTAFPGWLAAISIIAGMLFAGRAWGMSPKAHAVQLARRDCAQLLGEVRAKLPSKKHLTTEDVMRRLHSSEEIDRRTADAAGADKRFGEPMEDPGATAVFLAVSRATSGPDSPFKWLPEQRAAAFAAQTELQQRAVSTAVGCAVCDVRGLEGRGVAVDTEPYGDTGCVREVAVARDSGEGLMMKRLTPSSEVPQHVAERAPGELSPGDNLSQEGGRDKTIQALRRAQGSAPYLYVAQFGNDDLGAVGVAAADYHTLDTAQLPFARDTTLMALTVEFHMGGIQEDRALTQRHHDALCDAAAAGLITASAIEALRPAARAAVGLARDVFEAAIFR